ncbi:MAG: nicotinate phosphoribosyltransferase [Planctomycetes bacterium GWF2_41_51]|nr:MAG: nicotinate phosphoribosyltransferase [Planctomycetes bacterium GWF2_41_51]
MWLLNQTPALLTDLYELTMSQVYFKKAMFDKAYFEVTIRSLPKNWGFFVMAGLCEVASYLREFHFSQQDIEYLKSTGSFEDDFLNFLKELKLDVKIRCLPEGTIFFPKEPVFEISGPIIHVQILESYILNILGFSIIETTLATRVMHAAEGKPVVDFGLRRAQGPVAALRAARAAQIAGFAGTSNLQAANLLNFATSGTMAHSYIEAHESEETAFEHFIEQYNEQAVLLVNTYDPKKGITKAASAAQKALNEKGIKAKGIRIDSGDFVELSKFARNYFKEANLNFLKIFVSSGLDEYRMSQLIKKGAEIDGFGVGTRFSVSHNAPDVDIAYKIIEYAGKAVYKSSPNKYTFPGRKTILREKNEFYIIKDTVRSYIANTNDLLQPFDSPEPIETIKKRLSENLNSLPQLVKAIRKPNIFNVDIHLF